MKPVFILISEVLITAFLISCNQKITKQHQVDVTKPNIKICSWLYNKELFEIYINKRKVIAHLHYINPEFKGDGNREGFNSNYFIPFNTKMNIQIKSYYNNLALLDTSINNFIIHQENLYLLLVSSPLPIEYKDKVGLIDEKSMFNEWKKLPTNLAFRKIEILTTNKDSVFTNYWPPINEIP